VDLYFVQRDASGKTLVAEKQHIDVNLDEKKYEYLARTALVLDRHLTIHPLSTEIRVVIRDSGSGLLGSVTVPVGGFLRTDADPRNPR